MELLMSSCQCFSRNSHVISTSVLLSGYEGTDMGGIETLNASAEQTVSALWQATQPDLQKISTDTPAGTAELTWCNPR